MQASTINRGRTSAIIFTCAAILAAVGLADTTYLTATHLAGAQVACGATSSCSEVLGSIYSSMHGIPLAGIGALAYFAVFSLATLAAFGYQAARFWLAVLVGAMFFSTLRLLYLQAFVLHAYCTYCLASAAIIFLLAGLLVAAPPSRPAVSQS